MNANPLTSNGGWPARGNLRRAAVSALIAALVLGGTGQAAAAVIFVTTAKQKVSSNDPNDPGYEPGCSLQEAIFSANFDAAKAITYGAFGNSPAEVTTSCLPGSGADVIVLPLGAMLLMERPVDDASNFAGPTATPMITSAITIEAHGTTFKRTGQASYRLFAIGPGGSLRLRHAEVTGFAVKGGDGGGGKQRNDGGGGGGGMGAGGAIFVHAGTLLVEASTFAGNGATGGNGGSIRNWTTPDNPNDGGGGGGGIGGDGGGGACGNTSQFINEGSGGGGGGARGDGGPGSCGPGGGGGTITSGAPGRAGFACGGDSGSIAGNDGPLSGDPGACYGGGGGGGRRDRVTFESGSGGHGNYGGGGGGGAGGGGNGGRGGFGGGGGGGWAGTVERGHGGDGGFGGGGGSGSGAILDAVSGDGGRFGGNANRYAGGGGAALGGAIFNDSGSVTIINSTFTTNFALHGLGGATPDGGHAPHGQDAGAAVFSRNGELTVQFSTFAENVTHSVNSPLSGIVVIADGAATRFTLHNSLLAHNGSERECAVIGAVTVEFIGNLITRNDNCGTPASEEDPLLGPLQDNQGPTSTMAIADSSPARGAADPAVSLPTDQRGQERPSVGADLGAFELCVIGLPPIEQPCIITGGFGDVATFVLTMAASPSGVGSTTPSPGEHERAENSVVPVTALPGAGYYLVNWSGDITDPLSPSTTVVMTGNRTATAHFALIPDFSMTAGAVSVLVGGSQTTNVAVTGNAAFDRPVALTASGAPAGITPTFAPASVLMTPNGTQHSLLTVGVAAFVLPGIYTFSVVGTATNVPGPSPTTRHAVTVTVTVVATPAAVSGVVDVFTASGCIDSTGVANAFKAKLAAAQAMLDAGQTQQALNTLQALLRQLQAQQAKHVAAQCVVNGQPVDPTAVLIAQVQAIIASLGGSLRANPIVGSVTDAVGGAVGGAVVNLLNGARKRVASATADATGFYYLAGTHGLPLGTYTVSVTLPKGYKSSDPASHPLQWRGIEVVVGAFTVR